MQIFLQMRQDEVVAINVELTYSLGLLKSKIEALKSIPATQQLLVFAGKPMVDDDLQLKDYDVRELSKIYLVLKLRGGCDNPDGICTCSKQNPTN